MATITKEVKTYDFNKPEKVSKDQLRNLQILYENFSRVATVEWSAMLRTVVQVNLQRVSQGIYNEVISSWSGPCCIGVLGISPLEGELLVYVSPEFIFALIDRLLGGQGRVPPKLREFTELEVMLIRRLFGVVIESVKEVWHSLITLEPSLEEIETNPQFVQAFSPNEPVLTCEYNALIGDVTGKINLVISFISLEELLPRLSAQHMLKQGVEKTGKIGEKRLEDILVAIKGCFPSFLLSLSQIRKLKVGDIIDVHCPVYDKIDLWVNNKVIFKGILGKKDKKYAVKITDVFET